MTSRADLWTGRRVGLRPLNDQDLSWAYDETAHGRFGETWRFGWRVPRPSDFSSLMQTGSDETLLAFAREEPHRRLGLVQLYKYDERDRIGYVASALTESERMRGWPTEATVLFINYLFSSRPLRKLYFEGTDSALSGYRSLIGRYVGVEVRQVAHHYSNGHLDDVTTMSFNREAWSESREIFERAMFGGH
jgi:hypothetical protein